MFDSSILLMFAVLAAGAFLLAFLTRKLGIFSSIDKYDVRLTAKIIDLKPYEKFGGLGLYYPLLEYTFEGRTYREYSAIPDSPREVNAYLEIGAETRVFVNSEKPEEVSVKYIKGMGG